MPNVLTPAMLHRLLREHLPCRALLVSVCGARAAGYAHEDSPVELKGIHIEATENLVGLTQPPRAHNWIGEIEGRRIDFVSHEVGHAIASLLRGDGAILERVLAEEQLVRDAELARLQQLTRNAISRRFFSYYRGFSRGVLREYEDDEERHVAHVLSAYRTALSGVHLLRTGSLVVDLLDLAGRYGFADIAELVSLARQQAQAVLDEATGRRWVNRLVRVHALLEESYEESQLPVEFDDPRGLQDLLLDLRRRFFDAVTTQSG